MIVVVVGEQKRSSGGVADFEIEQGISRVEVRSVLWPQAAEIEKVGEQTLAPVFILQRANKTIRRPRASNFCFTTTTTTLFLPSSNNHTPLPHILRIPQT